MVELGNHQGRPPGCTQPLEMNTNETNQMAVPSLLEPWMNMDITSLEHAAELINGNTNGSTRDGTEFVSATTFLSSKDILGLLNSQELLEFDRSLELDGQASSQDLMSDKQMYLSVGDQDQLKSPPYTYVWGAPMDVDSLKLDDIFQVDEDDLIQGPTLAELNANDEPFFDLAFDDFITGNKRATNVTPALTSQSKIFTTSNDQRLSEPAYTVKKELPSLTHALSSTAVPAAVLTAKTQLQKEQSNGAKICSETVKQEQLGCGQHKKPILLGSLLGLRHRHHSERDTSITASTSTSNSLEKSSPSSIQTPLPARCRNDSTTDVSLCSLSSLSSLSNDEGFGSQAEDSDLEDQLTSEDESHTSESPETKFESTKLSKNTRKKKYFWQYNIQSKGPKGPRMTLNTPNTDPHVLNDVLDPVFSSECALEGVKHAGKARKGDGNDLTPNPRKLHSIGLELKSLNKMINDLAPVTNVPFNARPKTRKEKNKLASRACRLKKKAQHEANKLKLYGLQQEHRKLMHLVAEAKNVVKKHISDGTSPMESCTKCVEKIAKQGGEIKVAGHTAEYVNQVLDKVAQGQINGGLHDI